MAQETMEKRETADLIGSDKVEGTSIYNPQGEDLGHIERVMIDKRSGHVVYGVMSFGGFLGIGKKYHPLPWSVLEYDTNKGGYVVNLDKRTLEGAPTFDEGVDPSWSDPQWGRKVHDYYGATYPF
jgi:PRC-barrel domain